MLQINKVKAYQLAPAYANDTLFGRWSLLPFKLQKLLLLLIFTYITASGAVAQTHRSCATVEIQENRRNNNLRVETEQQFEKWLNTKIENKLNAQSRTTEQAVYTIPVVVHVIHNGEAIGNGTNISDAQVQSQIRILNEDYRRKTGTLGFNTNPAGADMEIEFKLALADPEGFPTTGIVRAKGIRQSWTTNDETTLKARSYWPSEHYLNIWVCNLSANVLGYAQFPESSQLQGVSAIGSEEASLDGVVIEYKYFGDQGAVLVSGNDFRYGRTTTHEIGHFLGLRHIWGDAPSSATGCNYDDYCQDTPNTAQANYDCPSSDSTTCSSPKSREMVENYMDYTDDACMNIFTQDQKMRMRTVLENSPRRKSLLTSPGLLPVTLVENNAAVERIISPGAFLCDNTFSPAIVLRNFGSNPLTQVTFRYDIDAGKDFTYTWNGNLTTAQRETITLPAIQTNPGNYRFYVSISQINNQTVADESGTMMTTPFTISTKQEAPFWANFNKTLLEKDWQILNEDEAITWQDTLVATSADPQNKAAYLNYYHYANAKEQDALLTASYDLSDVREAYLMFEVSYARRQASEDGLSVLVSTDCGNNFTNENNIYQKTGSRLATITATSAQPWYPTEENHWRKESIDLSDYLGKSQVRFAFVGMNDRGEEEVNGYKELAKGFQVFPNPSQGKFSLRFHVVEPLPVQVNVYNTRGLQVFSYSFAQAENTYALDLSHLPAGMYFIQAFSENEKVTKKVVITH